MYVKSIFIINNRYLPFFLYSESSLAGNSPSCPGGCAISNCLACYYLYNNLPSYRLSSSCPQQCSITNEIRDENCMITK